MTKPTVLSGVPLEEDALSVEEIARACAVSPDWIIERVQAGLIDISASTGEMRFASAQLVRARRLATTERRFECNPEAAALIADLIEEIERLRRELRAARAGR
jgi:chaperone modulatory protein CbpM